MTTNLYAKAMARAQRAKKWEYNTSTTSEEGNAFREETYTTQRRGMNITLRAIRFGLKPSEPVLYYMRVSTRKDGVDVMEVQGYGLERLFSQVERV